MIKYAIARTFIKDPAVIEAAAYIGEKVYQKPYTDFRGRWISANFTYTCHDGTIIHRPNHNMANILRSLHYLKPTLDYLASNGNDHIQALLNALDEQDIKKIIFMQLFYTSGRKNEVGFLENADIASQARADAAEHFKRYFEAKSDTTPFKDWQDIERCARILDKQYEPCQNPKDEALRVFLRIPHELDLLRCYPEQRLHESLVQPLNEYSQTPNNRDLQKLILYAQRCIRATGDLLRTQYQTQDIHGVHEETSFYLPLKRSSRTLLYSGNHSIVLGCKARNDDLFKAASQVDKTGILKTCASLEQVTEPFFFRQQPANIQTDGNAVLELIKGGNAIARTLNGSLNSRSFRFEVEQLTNPQYVRPIKEELLAKRHDLKVNLATGEIKKYSEKAYLALEHQPPLVSPPQSPTLQTVSRQQDRGKPKNTVFQKKCSYSLVPQSGLFSIFKGRVQDQVKPGFVAIGFLHDGQKMHLRGEKYIWSEDVRTSGIDSYFWLAQQENKKMTTHFPGLQDSRNRGHCQNLEALKATVNAPDNINQQHNEILASGSLASLAAIYATRYDTLHVLAALHAQSVLRRDYQVERPIIILDGKHPPQHCTLHQLERVFHQAKTQQRVWWRRLLHFFIPSQERLLLDAIEAVTGNQPFQPLRQEEPQNHVSTSEEAEATTHGQDMEEELQVNERQASHALPPSCPLSQNPHRFVAPGNNGLPPPSPKVQAEPPNGSLSVS
ncbi:MAG: hypothetical protein JJT82_04615 [Legionellaceae bacterium]|nr:hypothetical protein [Legionellaceae bacterium]